MEILKFVYSNGWTKSSDVAEGLNLHIATCSKYLEELTEIDLMEKRVVQGKTRKVNQYRVKDPKIELTYDLQTTKTDSSTFEFYETLYNSLIERTEDVCGSVPIDRLDFEDKCGEEGVKGLIKSIRTILEYNEQTLGLNHTKKLVKRSCMDIFEEYDDSIKGSGIDVLPPKYFDMLKEEECT
ncbi:MAG: hypothetical protein R6W73_06230 [Candidatus Saliniplasma sp.]